MLIASDYEHDSMGSPYALFPTETILKRLSVFFLANSISYDPEGLKNTSTGRHGLIWDNVVEPLLHELEIRKLAAPALEPEEITGLAQRASWDDVSDAKASGLIKRVHGHVWCFDGDHNEGEFFDEIQVGNFSASFPESALYVLNRSFLLAQVRGEPLIAERGIKALLEWKIRKELRKRSPRESAVPQDLKITNLVFSSLFPNFSAIQMKTNGMLDAQKTMDNVKTILDLRESSHIQTFRKLLRELREIQTAFAPHDQRPNFIAKDVLRRIMEIQTGILQAYETERSWVRLSGWATFAASLPIPFAGSFVNRLADLGIGWLAEKEAFKDYAWHLVIAKKLPGRKSNLNRWTTRATEWANEIAGGNSE